MERENVDGRGTELTRALRLDVDDATFRSDVRAWLAEHLTGAFAALHGRGGPGDEDLGFEERVEWERVLGRAGLIGLGWPVEHGGRGATLDQQIAWAEEYARAGAPGRVNHMGEHLLGPTLINNGTPQQRSRFLPGILDGSERWCQGYSEPGAGSDLANVSTRATLDDASGTAEWVIDGQKTWTSLAHVSHWCFALVRTGDGLRRHRGLTFLLVPMDQPGVETRPITQMSGGGEFCETFFTSARTDADMVVGDVGEGWSVAMGLLALERGISTLAQQVGFERELAAVVAAASQHGRSGEPTIRDRLATAHIGLELMKLNARRSMSSTGVPGPEASISKLFWGTWHRSLCELAVDVIGAGAQACELGDDDVDGTVRRFLFSRADTIYGGSNEIQRTIIGERVLGLPRAPS